MTSETEAPVAEPVAEPVTEPAAEPTEPPAEPAARKNPVQPRIDELTKKARENEREAAYWRARAEAKEAKEATAAAPKEPQLDQFTDYNEYVKALTDFKADEKIEARLKTRDAQDAERTKQQAFARTWSERVTAAKAAHADYEQVVSGSEVEVANHVKDVINDSEVGPALIYHLAQNPEIAARLNKMTPLGAAREMGRIEDQLAKAAPAVAETDAKSDPETPPENPAEVARKTSAAPPPAKPLTAARSTKPDLASADMADYVKTRKSQGARWAR